MADGVDTPAPISFTYVFGDYLMLNRMMRRDSLLERMQFVLVPTAAALAMVGFVTIQAAMTGRDVARAFTYLVGMWQFWAFIAAMLPLVWSINWLELKVYYRRQRIDGSVIFVSFDDADGIKSKGPLGEGTMSWSATRKLASDADAHVLLYKNRMIGLCLPRRAFASQQAFDDAGRYINIRIGSGKAA
jgi:hypothetical protein